MTNNLKTLETNLENRLIPPHNNRAQVSRLFSSTKTIKIPIPLKRLT